ncbi:MAG: NTP transferase domain-containing protein [Planctomycetota bacterium]|nr:NTP transferase domain-containing protein [Planctomycetota bacterium]
MSLTLVVLAAGASTRLGTCKALVDLGGRTPLDRLVEAGRAIASTPALVVTGADHVRIAGAAPQGVDVLENRSWAEGRLGGLALAARARPGSDLCVAPVDVPLVPAAVFLALRAAWLEAGEPPLGWLAPFLDRAGARRAYGHPIVIGRDLCARLSAIGKEVPMREVRALARPLLSIAVDSVAILDDLDTPADLERLRRRVS